MSLRPSLPVNPQEGFQCLGGISSAPKGGVEDVTNFGERVAAAEAYDLCMILV